MTFSVFRDGYNECGRLTGLVSGTVFKTVERP